MISRDLIRALNQEIHEGEGSRSCHLMALIDMALVPEDHRQEIAEHIADDAHPLLMDPQLDALKPLGPMLIGANGFGPAQYETVLAKVGARCAAYVNSWISSVVPPQELALHFSGATYAIGESNQQYLLRYYDPAITPLLYAHADREWVSRFFGPVLSWWFQEATQASSLWRRIRGRGRSDGSSPAQPLHLSTALWQVLESDPLPHRLLHTLEAQLPHVFDSACGGVRLAQVEAQLNAGRRSGLTRHEDLTTYVIVGMNRSWSQRVLDRRWQNALDRAVTGAETLNESLAALARASVKDVQS